MTWLRGDGQHCLLDVLINPRSHRGRCFRLHGDRLKIALTAPPVDGAVNLALCRYVAREAGVPFRQVALVKGHHSQRKTLRLPGGVEARLRGWVKNGDLEASQG